MSQISICRTLFAVIFMLTAVIYLGATPAFAQDPLPQDLIKLSKFDQNLDAQLPLDLEFTDSTGQQVALNKYFNDKPVILSLGYYECPMLCSLVRNGLFESLQQLDFTIGQDFQVIVVSIDPDETPEIAEAKRRASMMEYGRSTSPEGWNFLVGTEENIKQLADTVGFKYAYDPNLDEYVHPSGIMIVTPQGRVARYLFGIEYPATDLRLGLVESSQNKIGSPVDQLLLTCYHYDPASGEYTLAIMNIIRIVGVSTVLIIGGLLFVMLHRDGGKPATPKSA